jgi:hypothetical protein
MPDATRRLEPREYSRRLRHAGRWAHPPFVRTRSLSAGRRESLAKEVADVMTPPDSPATGASPPRGRDLLLSDRRERHTTRWRYGSCRPSDSCHKVAANRQDAAVARRYGDHDSTPRRSPPFQERRVRNCRDPDSDAARCEQRAGSCPDADHKCHSNPHDATRQQLALANCPMAEVAAQRSLQSLLPTMLGFGSVCTGRARSIGAMLAARS